jgi:hypothetical protein
MDKTHHQNRPTKTEIIREIDGKPVGTIRSDSKSGVGAGYDNLGIYKGKFDPRKNITYDNKGTNPIDKHG